MSPDDRTGILLIAKHGAIQCHLLPDMANRHGLITGATGTGKTITLQTLAEGFSRIGVPVFMADVKGDLTGMSASRAPSATSWLPSSRNVGWHCPSPAPAPPRCGMCLANRATRCAPPSATWGHCCWRACST